MRINDLVSQALGVPASQTIAGKRRIQAAPVAASGDGSSQQQSRVATPRVNYLATPKQQQEAVASRKADQADISDEARDLASGEEPATDLGENVLGAIVDEYIRQRTTMTYALPIRTANGMGSFTLTVDVERAYRVTKLVVPGQMVDAQG